MADLIVLAGGVGIEMAAKKAGSKINVPFSSRKRRCKTRTDRY